ncbi:hypothetical protein [Yersinia intermedia]|uniref:hypothetical protein n=1 Tax=Yersinia intermedia TaxID=631 RepID=UPI00065D02C1|nr:hypothetical protein [Yersinia intermedia]CRY84219.1 Uncharacterised protein [Yersinia intermedia]
MGKLNNTKNQHFISQVEQKLNSINPDDVRKKRRIYKFNVIDRENSKVVLVSANGSRIENSLSINDLFTYAINENGLRHNLEQEFENYEAKLESLTKEFLIKAGADRKEITHEIIGLFTCKFLNLIRNPYCIKKTLNIFSQYIDYKPTGPQLLAEYALISNIKEVDISSLLIRLGVTLTEYKNWLQVLFLVLMRNPGSEVNLLEEIIRSILSNNDTYKMFRIDHYLNSVAE